MNQDYEKLSDAALKSLLNTMGISLKGNDIECCICGKLNESCNCTEAEIKSFIEANVIQLQKEGHDYE